MFSPFFGRPRYSDPLGFGSPRGRTRRSPRRYDFEDTPPRRLEEPFSSLFGQGQRPRQRRRRPSPEDVARERQLHAEQEKKLVEQEKLRRAEILRRRKAEAEAYQKRQAELERRRQKEVERRRKVLLERRKRQELLQRERERERQRILEARERKRRQILEARRAKAARREVDRKRALRAEEERRARIELEKRKAELQKLKEKRRQMAQAEQDSYDRIFVDGALIREVDPESEESEDSACELDWDEGDLDLRFADEMLLKPEFESQCRVVRADMNYVDMDRYLALSENQARVNA